MLSSLLAHKGDLRRRSLDVGGKYHHIFNANPGNMNHGMDSLTLFAGVLVLPMRVDKSGRACREAPEPSFA